MGGHNNVDVVSGAPDKPEMDDLIERVAKDGTVVRFKRSIGVPNQNFWNVYIGSKNFGYIAKQMTGRHWTIAFNLVEDLRYTETGEEAVLNIVKTVDVIMG